jgi:hypothetical protein
MARYRFDTEQGFRGGIAPARSKSRLVSPNQTTLERDFPHVMTAMQAMWGYPELNAYFDRLTINERGQRKGFPPDVWDDIYLLWSIHRTLAPLSATDSGISCA